AHGGAGRRRPAGPGRRRLPPWRRLAAAGPRGGGGTRRFGGRPASADLSKLERGRARGRPVRPTNLPGVNGVRKHGILEPDVPDRVRARPGLLRKKRRLPAKLGLLKRLFDSSEKEPQRLREIVVKINEYEPEMSRLSQADLRAKTGEFRQRLENGATLDDLLPEAFAVVREAAKRTLGMRHFDVQLMGGIVLHQGRIAEMKTGEGKTLVATLPIYLNALTGKGVHLVTVND